MDLLPLLSEREAAALIGMSCAYLRMTRTNGLSAGPRYLKLGRAVRYDRADLLEWLEGRRRNCGDNSRRIGEE